MKHQLFLLYYIFFSLSTSQSISISILPILLLLYFARTSFSNYPSLWRGGEGGRGGEEGIMRKDVQARGSNERKKEKKETERKREREKSLRAGRGVMWEKGRGVL